MILLRHGESLWNERFGRTRIDPGIGDPQLTERGRAQARAIAEELRPHDLVRIVSSPYRRTLETAGIIAAALDIPIEVDVDVRERAAFSCDIGTPPAELARIWPDLDLAHIDTRWWSDPIETMASVVGRSQSFSTRSRDRADSSRTLVVTHWGFIRALTGVEAANGTLVRLP